MSVELEIYKDSEMISRLVESEAFLDKEATVASSLKSGVKKLGDKVLKAGKKEGKNTIKDFKDMGKSVSKGIKKKYVGMQRNMAESERIKALEKYKENTAFLKRTGSKGSGDLMLKSDAVKSEKKILGKTKRKIKRMRKQNVNYAAGGAAVGGAGTYEYMDGKQRDKAASIALVNLDKEASVGTALKGVRRFLLKERQFGFGRSVAPARGAVDLGRMSVAKPKFNAAWGKPTASGGVNMGKMTPKATINTNKLARKASRKAAVKKPAQKGAVNLGAMKVNKPAPRRGAVDLGAMNVTKPGGNIPGTGLKAPVMTMRNLKRAGVGAVGLTAGSQVYDGLGGGGNQRRIINNY